ncbi:hypothetical protein C8R44DRAFT_750333 [Mycena epipterygia]|nr:hypothetical protein C8R44DRAFT_750333 [Mycena epipterygia]
MSLAPRSAAMLNSPPIVEGLIINVKMFNSHPRLILACLGLGLNLFIRYASLARENIEFGQVNRSECPTTLPLQILRLLATALGEKDTRLIEICCSDCPNHRAGENISTLVEPLTYNATLFTLRHGALPIYTTSLYCRSCNRWYYHNYYVHKQTSLRTYYGGVPDVVQVAQHFFIESALLELFANNMVLTTKHFTRNDWKVTSSIRKEDPVNGFFLYSLLLEEAEQGGILILPHDEASQSYRLQPALAELNSATEGTGQECYVHACDLCFVIVKNEQGQLMKIQAVACDGNTIGHRSCKVHDCKNPLPSLRQHFCVNHQYLRMNEKQELQTGLLFERAVQYKKFRQST